jgi:hypothetical protein
MTAAPACGSARYQRDQFPRADQSERVRPTELKPIQAIASIPMIAPKMAFASSHLSNVRLPAIAFDTLARVFFPSHPPLVAERHRRAMRLSLLGWRDQRRSMRTLAASAPSTSKTTRAINGSAGSP